MTRHPSPQPPPPRHTHTHSHICLGHRVSPPHRCSRTQATASGWAPWGEESSAPPGDSPQTKSQPPLSPELLSPVIRSYRKSDCPGPVTGKNIKDFLLQAARPGRGGRPGLSLRPREPCFPQDEGCFSLLPCAFLLGTLQGAPDTLQRGTGRGGAGGGGGQQQEAGRVGTERPGPVARTRQLLEPGRAAQSPGYSFLEENALRRLPLQSLHFAAGTPKPAKGGGPAQGCRDSGDTEGKQTQSSGGQVRALFITPPTALPLSRPASLPPSGQVSSEGKKRDERGGGPTTGSHL